MTVETTDDEFAWVGSWFETQLLRVWYADHGRHAKLSDQTRRL